ncbi:RNA cytidine acetyltransferase [Trichinella spiralis]|uniref:RNA cytidine acetyltransferase n=2 Tax=Trichinella spiralis TaxID=6334 RepID=A0ABR3KGY9_TRISP
MKIIPCRDEIDEQPEVKELKAVIFKGRVEAAAFTAIPYEKVVDRAAEEYKNSKKAMAKEDSSPLKAEIKAELEIKKLKYDGIDKEMETEEIKLVVEEKNDEENRKAEGDAEINDEKKKNSNKSKKSKNKSKKTDLIPLKAEVKSEPEIKEIMHNNKNEGMETKEEAPEAEKKVTEEVGKAAEEVEIKGEKKKNNSNKKSNSKNSEKKEIEVTPQTRKIPSKDNAEMQPVKNEVNADIVKRGIESAKCAAILPEKSFEKVGKYVKALENVDMKMMKKTSTKSTKSEKYSEEIIPKDDLNPLKEEIKSKTEIKKSTHDVEEEEIETKELTPVVEEKIPEEVDEAEEEVEIKDEERKKKEAKEKSDDISETPDNMNDEEIETEELTPVDEEKIPEEVDEAEEEVEIKDEERKKKKQRKNLMT